MSTHHPPVDNIEPQNGTRCILCFLCCLTLAAKLIVENTIKRMFTNDEPLLRRALHHGNSTQCRAHDDPSVFLSSRPPVGRVFCWQAPTVLRRKTQRIRIIFAVVATSLMALQVIYLKTHTLSAVVKQRTTKRTTTETVTIDAGSCVYSTRHNYEGPFLCTRQRASAHSEAADTSASSSSSATGTGHDEESLLAPPDIIRIVFDNATEHGPRGPDARIYYARDLTDPAPSECEGIGPIPNQSDAINILYTEESSELDTLVHDTKAMASFGVYLGFDPRPSTGFVFNNFGFDHLVKRLDYPIAPPNQRMSSSLLSTSDGGGGGGLVVWAATNCNSFSSRLAYLIRLNKIARVHSLGNCWRTHTPSATESGGVFGGLGGNSTQEWEYMGSTYKFWYAAENFLCDGYVTEKFWMPFAFGSVPILYGTSVHASYAPSHDSYLDVRNFTSPEDLGRFLLRLDQDDELYMKYHAWRTRPREEWNRNFVDLLNRHRRGRQFRDGTRNSTDDSYVYVNEHGESSGWECQVGAEVLRMKQIGAQNQLAALPECTDPKGDSIPMALDFVVESSDLKITKEKRRVQRTEREKERRERKRKRKKERDGKRTW